MANFDLTFPGAPPLTISWALKMIDFCDLVCRKSDARGSRGTVLWHQRSRAESLVMWFRRLTESARCSGWRSIRCVESVRPLPTSTPRSAVNSSRSRRAAVRRSLTSDRTGVDLKLKQATRLSWTSCTRCGLHAAIGDKLIAAPQTPLVGLFFQDQKIAACGSSYRSPIMDIHSLCRSCRRLRSFDLQGHCYAGLTVFALTPSASQERARHVPVAVPEPVTRSRGLPAPPPRPRRRRTAGHARVGPRSRLTDEQEPARASL